MISDRTLGVAVDRELITVAQADALRAIEHEDLVAKPSIAPAAAQHQIVQDDTTDDEALRFVTGFADIFVTIGIALFIGALCIILRQSGGSILADSVSVAAAWLLAEFFTRRRRMALPSIALLVIIVVCGFSDLLFLFGSKPEGQFSSWLFPAAFWLLPSGDGQALILAGLGTAALAALHYARFHVPITVAAGVAAVWIAILGVVFSLRPDLSFSGLNGLVLACGILTFTLAMRFDLSDPMRATRRTDIAFWLHLLAAPLIVHTLIRGFLHGLDDQPTKAGALGVLGVFFLLGLIAVVIDRRAILVSGLVYAGFAFGTLISTSGLAHSDLLVPVVLLILGTFILLLSAGWRPLRHVLLKRLPAALASRLPHPLVASAS